MREPLATTGRSVCSRQYYMEGTLQVSNRDQCMLVLISKRSERKGTINMVAFPSECRERKARYVNPMGQYKGRASQVRLLLFRGHRYLSFFGDAISPGIGSLYLCPGIQSYVRNPEQPS